MSVILIPLILAAFCAALLVARPAAPVVVRRTALSAVLVAAAFAATGGDIFARAETPATAETPAAAGTPTVAQAPAADQPETAPAAGQWRMLGCKQDELDDSKRCVASSPWAEISRQFASFIRYQCGQRASGEKWETPTLVFRYLNLTDEVDGEGPGKYEYYRVASRWDREAVTEELFWKGAGGDNLFWDDAAKQREAVRNFGDKNQFRVRLDYFADGRKVFVYSLAGAKDAIAEARSECGLDEDGLPEAGE